MELANVLISPVVTEKSTQGQEARKYTFLVRSEANKIEVAKAIENAYGVKVKKINIVPVLKKIRMASRTRAITKRHAAKKAIVTIGAKDSIDFNKFKK